MMRDSKPAPDYRKSEGAWAIRNTVSKNNQGAEAA